MTNKFLSSLFVIVIFVGLFSEEYAIGAEARAFEIGLSATSYHMQTEVKSESGDKSLFGHNYYDFRFQYHLLINPNLFFSPAINYMPTAIHNVKSPDGGQKSNLNVFLLPVTYNYSPAVDFTGGLALVRYTLSTKGGTKVLSNGESTAEFGLPGRTVTTTTMGWVFGGAFTYLHTRVGTNLLVHAPLSNIKRTYSLELFVSRPIYTL
jgi:hypothetical protein